MTGYGAAREVALVCRNFDLRYVKANKPTEQVRSLVGGSNGVFICNECVDLCREIFDEQGVPIGAKGTT